MPSLGLPEADGVQACEDDCVRGWWLQWGLGELCPVFVYTPATPEPITVASACLPAYEGSRHPSMAGQDDSFLLGPVPLQPSGID